jgi:hypothetical protein
LPAACLLLACCLPAACLLLACCLPVACLLFHVAACYLPIIAVVVSLLFFI